MATELTDPNKPVASYEQWRLPPQFRGKSGADEATAQPPGDETRPAPAMPAQADSADLNRLQQGQEHQSAPSGRER